jgi:hypothetical protein
MVGLLWGGPTVGSFPTTKTNQCASNIHFFASVTNHGLVTRFNHAVQSQRFFRFWKVHIMQYLVDRIKQFMRRKSKAKALADFFNVSAELFI